MKHPLRFLATLALFVAFSTPALTARAEEGKFGAKGHLELDFESEHNFDLDDKNWEDFATLEPEMRLRLWYVPSRYFQLFFQPRPRRKSTLHDEDKKKERSTVIQVEQAYAASEFKDGAIAVYFGRTEFKDSREWLYDIDLDGLRVGLTALDIRMDLSVNRQTYASEDLLHHVKEDPVNNFHVYAEYELPSDGYVAAYWLGQDEVDVEDQRRHFLGLRAAGQPIKGLECAAELVHVRGRDGRDKIRGAGADIVFHYVLPVGGKPYPILGYAIGSGDDDPDDGTDRTFRQTGFQDNNVRFGGVTKYTYYGMLLDPNLSNMMILTAGAGFRPSKKSSIDLLYHHYRQHRASDSLWDSSLDADPSGESRDLGQELDLVIGYREIKNLRIEAVTSWFAPGTAFASDAADAFFAGIEARYLFSTEE